MEICHLPSTCGELLANADELGIVSWVHNKVYLERENLLDPGSDELTYRKMLADYMFSLFFMHSDDLQMCATAEYLKKLDPMVEAHPDSDEFVILSANVCALFGLPGTDPKAELNSIRSIMLTMKSAIDWFYEQNQDNDERVSIHVFNSFQPPVLTAIEVVMGYKSGPIFDEMMRRQDKLHEMIANDPNLQTWMHYQRELLNSKNAHAWFTYRDDQFYEYGHGPLNDRIDRQLAKKRNKL